ncbi:hypothetical protein GGE65_004287 [Skermanella aerolata]
MWQGASCRSGGMASLRRLGAGGAFPETSCGSRLGPSIRRPIASGISPTLPETKPWGRWSAPACDMLSPEPPPWSARSTPPGLRRVANRRIDCSLIASLWRRASAFMSAGWPCSAPLGGERRGRKATSSCWFNSSRGRAGFHRTGRTQNPVVLLGRWTVRGSAHPEGFEPSLPKHGHGGRAGPGCRLKATSADGGGGADDFNPSTPIHREAWMSSHTA